MTQQELLQEISGKVQAGRAKAAKELVQQAIEEGIPAQQILEEGLLAGLNVIGVKFKNNEVFVPEVLIAARAMNQGVGILKPLLAQSETKVSGRVCIGTVKGDLKGLDVIDMGVDVAPEAFIQTAIDQDCQVIMCSALLTTTMGVMGDVVAGAEKAGIRDRVKIMVGGAPVTETFCQQIGADAYTPDATSAAEKAVEFCKEILG